jgi:hypothetical protein
MANLSGLTAAFRDQVRAIDPNEPVFQVIKIKMDERLSNSVAERRFQRLLLSFFATAALVISYAVSRRIQEIGVTLKAAAALAITRVLKNLLYATIGTSMIKDSSKFFTEQIHDRVKGDFLL